MWWKKRKIFLFLFYTTCLLSLSVILTMQANINLLNYNFCVMFKFILSSLLFLNVSFFLFKPWSWPMKHFYSFSFLITQSIFVFFYRCSGLSNKAYSYNEYTNATQMAPWKFSKNRAIGSFFVPSTKDCLASVYRWKKTRIFNFLFLCSKHFCFFKTRGTQ